jgi:hypothetical protein
MYKQLNKIVIAIIVVGVIIAGVLIYTFTKGDTLGTAQISLEDKAKKVLKVNKDTIEVPEPEEKDDGIESPLGYITIEAFKNIVMNNEFIKKNYTLEENNSQILLAMNDDGGYRFTNSYVIYGFEKGDTNSDLNFGFEAYLGTINTFKSPNSVRFTFNINNSYTEEEIDNVAKELLSKLFNEDLANKLISEKEAIYKSESGEFELRLAKMVNEVVEDKKTIHYSVEYGKSEDEHITLDKVEDSLIVDPLYKNFEVYDGNISDGTFARKLSTLYGDGVLSNTILSLFNHKIKSDNKEFNESIISVKIHLEDDVSVQADLGIQLENKNEGHIWFETSTQYLDSPEEAMDSAINIVNGVFKSDLRVDPQDYEDWKLEAVMVYKGFDREFSGGVTVEIYEDEYGYYGSIVVDLNTGE